MNNHEYANLFPMMGENEIQTLSKDIKENGLQESIILFENEILDGRNRYKACEIAGVKPIMEQYEGDDALAFVVSHNLHRRHLSESQRSFVASKLANMTREQNLKQNSERPIGTSDSVSISQASEMLNVGETSVKRARRVQRDGSDELVKAVESGDLKVSAADDLRKLPKAEQVEVLSQGADAVREKVAEIRRTPKESMKVETKYDKGITLDSRGKPLHNIGSMMRMQAMTCMQRILDEDGQFEEAFIKMRDYCNKRLSENKRTKEKAY